eukprot:5214057-Amphidinium_carterae.1
MSGAQNAFPPSIIVEHCNTRSQDLYTLSSCAICVILLGHANLMKQCQTRGCLEFRATWHNNTYRDNRNESTRHGKHYQTNSPMLKSVTLAVINSKSNSQKLRSVMGSGKLGDWAVTEMKTKTKTSCHMYVSNG